MHVVKRRASPSIRLIAGGRLGNQLIQYAAVRAQAKRVGADLEIDLQYLQGELSDSFAFWLEKLPIKARVIRYPKNGFGSAHGIPMRAYRKLIQPMLWKRYDQPLWSQDQTFFGVGPGTVVTGYFQSLLYLLPRDREVMSEVDLRAAASPEALSFANTIEKGGFVSIHVRRGDAVWRQGESDTLPVWQSDYLAYVEAAMDLVRRKVERPRFLVFSDDIEWCKTVPAFGRDCEFVEPDRFGPNPAIDLLFMSVCRHHIVANSTFSWWAAWVQPEDKICILPKKWSPRDTTQTLGLVYPGWIVL